MKIDNGENTHKNKSLNISIKKTLIFMILLAFVVFFVSSFLFYNSSGSTSRTMVCDNASSIFSEIEDLEIEVLSIEMNITRRIEAKGGVNIAVLPCTVIYKINLKNAKVIESKDGEIFVKLPEIKIDIPQLNESAKEILVQEVTHSWKGNAKNGVDSAIFAQSKLQKEEIVEKLKQNISLISIAKDQAKKVVENIIKKTRIDDLNKSINVFF